MLIWGRTLTVEYKVTVVEICTHHVDFGDLGGRNHFYYVVVFCKCRHKGGIEIT